MTLIEVTIGVVGGVAVGAAIVYGLYCVVGWARRRQKRAYAIGAALAPFMAMGHVVDPDFRIVHEAKQHKKQEEDDDGEPSNDDNAAAPADPGPTAPKIRRVLARVPRRKYLETFG